MSKPSFDLSLYLVTDQSLLPKGKDLAEVLEAAIEGGVTLVQLREKTLDTRSFVETAQRILKICRAANVPLLINDRLDVALAIDADGVHLGQSDMPAATARKLLGPNKIVGVTVETIDQALLAVKDGADYLGTAAIFATNTKKHPDSFKPLDFEGVREILTAVAHVRIPVTTIGGINLQNVEDVLSKTVLTDGSGYRLQGVAVVSAIIAQSDPKAASAALLAKIRPLTTSSPSKSLSGADAAASILVEQVADAFNLLRAKKPLIHNITNYVVMNDTANVILQTGGLPVMAHSNEEVADITAVSQALVINIGTLSPQWIDGMKIAGKKANEVAIPIVLDPVGAGFTPFRKKTCMELIHELDITIIKGNAGEIGAIAGMEGLEMRGVESVGTMEDPEQAVRALAHDLKLCVAMSGAVDVISDGTRTVSIKNGNEWLGTLTGTGCSTTAMIACFAGVVKDPLVAAVGGLLCMGIAAEVAVKQNANGPGSFKVALHDSIFRLTDEVIREKARLTVTN
ncbi:hypothetical protein PhCBS80983_g01159 [Powellomyces hirtus]|uniref:Thiamine phosphate synthase/TenI domain-containing protein n=1 Tax=Powellomyces hirtus TaxID=109895 RepID=A0A507EDU7_9FUNG|nr:hypothetical protein PhCBS80983_g01159 [Powellomyces hirtus]